MTTSAEARRAGRDYWRSACYHLLQRDEAGRLVGEYLDQTREVFGDALRFQRELFSELRALRSGAPT